MTMRFILSSLILAGLAHAVITKAGPGQAHAAGPYKEHVKCLQALKEKAKTPNSIDDQEVFLPGQLADQPGLFWFDHNGTPYFFNTKVDFPEAELFRKITPDSEHWIVDFDGAKRLYYLDEETDKVYHYGFFMRVQREDKSVPFRFVWMKDKTFSTNSELKMQSIPEFAQTLHSIRRKWSRRVISRALMTVGHKVTQATNGKNPQVEKVMIDELKSAIPSVHVAYIEEKTQRSEHRAPVNPFTYVRALKECEGVEHPGLMGMLHNELSKFKTDLEEASPAPMGLAKNESKSRSRSVASVLSSPEKKAKKERKDYSITAEE